MAMEVNHSIVEAPTAQITNTAQAGGIAAETAGLPKTAMALTAPRP